MERERIRFGVDLDRETDVEFKKLAKVENRSKRNFHQVFIQRAIRVWKNNPEALVELGLIQR